MSTTVSRPHLSRPGLSLLSPGFRKVAFPTIDVVFAGFVVFLILFSSRQTTSTSLQPAGPAQASVTTPSRPQVASARELIVSDLQVTPDYDDFDWYRYRNSGYQLTAQVKNISALPSGPIRGELVALDCHAADTCQVTGQEPLDTRVSILPGGTARLQVHVLSNSIAPASYQRVWRIDFDEPPSN